MTERILLMPGSRIEIAVDRATADGFTAQIAPLSARLRSYGFFTGGAVGWGDNWPAVDLADVEFADQPVQAAAAAPHALRHGGPAVPRRVDSYPVPIGGLLHIRVPFTRQQVGGRFVFHCHILEHEDKGMMAEIAVLPH